MTIQTLRQSSGFSILEIMVTISVVAIIVLLSDAPARAFHQQQSIRSTHQLLLDQLYHARSEARLEHEIVRLCQSNDAEFCSREANWSTGWIIFFDLNNDGKRSKTEPLLGVQNALNNTLNVRLFAGGRAKSIKIDEWGVIRTSGRIEICSTAVKKPSQTISFTRSGYLRPGIKNNTCD